MLPTQPVTRRQMALGAVRKEMARLPLGEMLAMSTSDIVERCVVIALDHVGVTD